ncbi:MAG: hypothetical protein ABIW79_02715 [Gemmatimonas sp.]
MTNAPYAGPTTRPTLEIPMASDAVVAPYVPAQWRACSEPTANPTKRDLAASAPAHVDDSLPPIGSFLQESEVVPATTDDWPFHDAGEQTTELSSDLPGAEATAAESGHGVAPPPLPMWNDDDMMDIMPTATNRPSSANLASRDTPSPETSEQGSFAHTESAARALESLAHRVRSGELHLAGYVPELGDAAALAAALAALLGIRR